MSYEVKHISDQKLELHQNGENMGYLDYHTDSTYFYLDYVYVEPKYRNNQVGIEVVREGVKLALEKGLIPKPICGYAAAVMKRKNWPEDF